LEIATQAVIERREGFIEEQNVRIDRERPAQSGTLPHAVRQIRRESCEALVRKPQPRSQPLYDAPPLGSHDTQCPQSRGHILAGVEPQQEPQFLEHDRASGKAVPLLSAVGSALRILRPPP
jgi:hypothetical protein